MVWEADVAKVKYDYYSGKKGMEKKNVYLDAFGFLAGLTNSLSIIMIGVFTTHVTGAATNAGVNLGGSNLLSFGLYVGLLSSFIAGGVLGAGLTGRRGFSSAIFFSGALLIVAGAFAPAKIAPRSMEQFFFAFLVAMAMGAQNASTTLTPIGRSTHITGASTDFGAALAKGDRKNLIRLGLFLLCFITGTFVAFFLQTTIGPRGFLLVGVGLILVGLLQRRHGF
jgi:uncharacterized membrane protein YoaK (UPF0700 family)